MTIPFVKSAFSSGEVSPSLWGRVDLARWHTGCSVARNFIVNYKGGLLSRGGTKIVGISKQDASDSSYPPRLIEFTFSNYQSYVLEFGEKYMRVIANGGYVTEASFAITGATQADPCVIHAAGHNFADGDWVYIAAISGMTELNGRIGIVSNANIGAGTIALQNVFGGAIDTTYANPYVSGGTIARIYTLTTTYAAADLPWLKSDQSADVMSLCCVNQESGVQYPTKELTRLAANNWTLTDPTFASTITAPGSVAATPSNTYSGGTEIGPVAYGYVVTSVDATTGQESIASAIGACTGSVAIELQFGSITVSWAARAGAGRYHVYKAPADYTNTGAFTNQLFGYIGSTDGAVSFQDVNLLPDITNTPPLHFDPFTGAGNAPGVVGYFQQRRVYGYSLNQPDTYQMSRPGSYTNFDAADPTIDSDAITGTPWGKQVNGIQHLLPMPGGLLVFTGKTAWQVSGTGGAYSPITPAQQLAQPQESIGCSATVPPIAIGYNILYVQALGAIVREINYNYFVNIYAGVDITILSSHLFHGLHITQWAWAQEPYKVMWCVRDDGKMLALTYLKDEEIKAWTRHDTQGLAVSVATASEPPVNAVYWCFKRWVPDKERWLYCIERMDARMWSTLEDAWCVDSALDLAQPTPSATLRASVAAPSGACLPGPVILGGSGYVAPSGSVRDLAGKGSGAVVGSIIVSGGAITAYTLIPGSIDYEQPVIEFSDSAGSGALADVLVDKSVTFTADAGVFAATDQGKVIRMGGGKATITTYVSPTEVTAQFEAPITALIPNDPDSRPLPARSGAWTMTKPVLSVAGLDHLEGATVTGLADGKVIPPTKVVSGQLTLAEAASDIVVGLPFIAQAQSLHADMQGKLLHGKRKRIPSVTIRIANSRGLKIGQDQPIAAAQPNQAEVPWDVTPYLMTPLEDGTLAQDRLFTGDRNMTVVSDYQTVDGQASPAMVAVMQDQPLPAEILAFVPDIDVGDTE